MGAENNIVIKTVGVSKHFGGIQALRSVDFEIRAGEVMGLVGDNGAGKSTLTNVLTGIYPPDEGTLYLNGDEIRFSSRQHAKDLGIEAVYQELGLVDSLDAGANMFLGSELTKRFLGLPLLDNTRMRVEATDTLKQRLGIVLGNVKTPVFHLSGGQKQSVAIGRAIRKSGTQALILDEPTAAMGPEETGKILTLVRHLADQGMPVVIIAHNLEHVFSVSDRITVLRHGGMVGVRITAQSSRKEILGLIIGAEEEVPAASDGKQPPTATQL